MWEGKVTDELLALVEKYVKMTNGIPPDGYDEICYEGMPYERFVGYIREALKQGVELPDVVPPPIPIKKTVGKSQYGQGKNGKVKDVLNSFFGRN